MDDDALGIRPGAGPSMKGPMAGCAVLLAAGIAGGVWWMKKSDAEYDAEVRKKQEALESMRAADRAAGEHALEVHAEERKRQDEARAAEAPFDGRPFLADAGRFAAPGELKPFSGEPYRRGKILVFQANAPFAEEGAALGAERFQYTEDLPREWRPRNPGEVETLVSVTVNYVLVCEYNEGSKGYREVAAVRVIDLSIPAVVAETEITGPDPGEAYSKRANRGAMRIWEPTGKQIAEYMKTLPLKID